MGSYEKLVMSLWAKKEDRLGQLLWLPLKQHLLDTMNVSRWLWENWLSDSQRKFCIKSISSATYESASNLAAFLGAIHDIGKATPVFQTQKRFHNKDELSLKLIICFSNRLSKGGSIFIWFNFSCVTNKITLNCLLTSEEVLKLANAILVKYLSAIFI